MTRSLALLLDGLGARIHGDSDRLVTDLCCHSEQVHPGSLFIALRGTCTDGHRFVDQAIRAGAAALVLEKIPEPCPLPVAEVADTRSLLPKIASRFFDHPARFLRLVGVTGTNGKTSTVRMIESILLQAGTPTGSIGTVSVRFGNVDEPARLTTPGPIDLQRTLARMRDAKIETVVLEVSSHSLAQDRIASLRFAAAVFTNLSQDHLDYHADMQAYAETKAKLFGARYLDGPAILNTHDPQSDAFARCVRDPAGPVIRFGRGPQAKAEVRTLEEQITLEGSLITLQTPNGCGPVRIPLPGEFQIDNALAAAATGMAFGIDQDTLAAGLARCPAIPGRLQRVGSGLPIVLVDYAHTPDALDRLLSMVRARVQGRLITVFGCGGDRDPGKRAPMAQAVCRHSHYTIATSDNPRKEDPKAILDDVARGLSGKHEIVQDRRAAIRQAIAQAAIEDTIVIAGKGHETVQIVGSQRHPFDDREEALLALQQRETPA